MRGSNGAWRNFCRALDALSPKVEEALRLALQGTFAGSNSIVAVEASEPRRQVRVSIMAFISIMRALINTGVDLSQPREWAREGMRCTRRRKGTAMHLMTKDENGSENEDGDKDDQIQEAPVEEDQSKELVSQQKSIRIHSDGLLAEGRSIHQFDSQCIHCKEAKISCFAVLRLRRCWECMRSKTAVSN